MLEISKEDIKQRLAFDNPWWGAQHAVDRRFREWPRRHYFRPFLARVQSAARRAVVLMGPRRVGKTVLLHQCVQHLLDEGVPPSLIVHVPLDTPIYIGMPLEGLTNTFLQRFGHDRETQFYAFFDEIQYLRDWEVHLKSLVDSFPNARIAVSGSAAAALRLKSLESGAGRFTDFHLPPLTFAEYLDFVGREAELVEGVEDGVRARDIDALNDEFVNYLNYGGFPEAVFSEAVRREPEQYIRHDIIDRVLLRDLPSLYGISDIQDLYRLFTTIAYNSGQEVTLEALSQRGGVSKNTLKRYLEYLEAAFLVTSLDRIDQDGRRYKRRTRFKVYLTNPAVRAALFQPAGPDHEVMGALAETAIVAQWLHSKDHDRLFYARWRGGEVDLVHKDISGEIGWAVEVKWSDRFVERPRDLKALLRFSRRNRLQWEREPPAVLVTTRSRHALIDVDGQRVEFEPTALYCYSVGRNGVGDDPGHPRPTGDQPLS